MLFKFDKFKKFKKFKTRVIFYVIETSTLNESLIQEITQKIEILKSHIPDLLKFFNLDQNYSCIFKGFEISSNNTNIYKDKQVKILNFKSLIKSLEDLRIKKRRLRKILELI